MRYLDQELSNKKQNNCKQIMFSPFPERQISLTRIEQKIKLQRQNPRFTSINDTKIIQLKQFKQYKMLRDKKKAKYISDAFQIKSINLIKKVAAQKQNKIPKKFTQKYFISNKYKKDNKKRNKSQSKIGMKVLSISTTSLINKRFNTSHKQLNEQILKSNYDFKLQLFLKGIDQVSKTHGIQRRKTQDNQKKTYFKAYIGKGNNAGLVKQLIKRRWWWAISQDKLQCKLIWSQLKDKNYYLFRSDTLHNHFLHNQQIGSKKLLFHNMNNYYKKKSLNTFNYLPQTFHIINLEDQSWIQFVDQFKKKKQTHPHLVWILKPGQNSNRGNGITIHNSLDQMQNVMKNILFKDKKITFIIQQYIDKPFLYNNRKFDIRCFILLVKLGNSVQCYWCKQGYIRTCSYQFKQGQYENNFIHLTNDAIQVNSEDYGKFEEGNKLSFSTFQKYLDSKYTFKYNFQKQVYPLIKQIAIDITKASIEKMGIDHPNEVFQLYGLDYMIDSNFKPWLIEVNTNPTIQTSSIIQSKLMPRILDDAFKLSIDVAFPPPENWPKNRKHLVPSISNCFQLLYSKQ